MSQPESSALATEAVTGAGAIPGPAVAAGALAASAPRLPLYLQVAHRIREAIIAGHLAPGDPLPTERELAESFEVSRASVREALRALQAEGLVAASGPPARTVVVPGAAAHARDALVTLLRLNGVGVGDLMSFRTLLECESVAAAAEAPRGPWFTEAHIALAAMRDRTQSAEEYDRADLHFHMALAQGSGNAALYLVMQALRGAVAKHLLEHLTSRPDLPTTLARLTAEHGAILTAIEAGDGAAAQRLVRNHIRAFYSRGGG
ncbi:MAG: GntR family transcriptional regulator [Miltoncostaeaceae bacterium]